MQDIFGQKKFLFSQENSLLIGNEFFLEILFLKAKWWSFLQNVQKSLSFNSNAKTFSLENWF